MTPASTMLSTPYTGVGLDHRVKPIAAPADHAGVGAVHAVVAAQAGVDAEATRALKAAAVAHVKLVGDGRARARATGANRDGVLITTSAAVGHLTLHLTEERRGLAVCVRVRSRYTRRISAARTGKQLRLHGVPEVHVVIEHLVSKVIETAMLQRFMLAIRSIRKRRGSGIIEVMFANSVVVQIGGGCM